MARLLPEALQFSWRTDHELVAAVRRGEQTAFEQLYSRYRMRIWSYISGILRDADRAEDVSQDVFISVLRRLRDTERPIAFKPWIYQIARNACIDELRRARRLQEVPFDPEGEPDSVPDDLFSSAPGPDLAVESKQRLEDLRGAFRGLSELHHRILVLRELEGLSYSEIGTRLGISRPVVESTLFRARRRLAEEYQELISGRRCEHTRAVIDASHGRTVRRLGVRDTRQLARHLAHCRPCRRHAMLAGATGSLVAGGTPPVAGSMPVVAGGTPPVAGSMPVVAGGAPQVADSMPVVAGGTPPVAGSMPVVAGGTPPVADSMPVVAGGAPQVADVARPLPAEQPIPLASRWRPANESAVLTPPGPDSLAVA